jgi:hypothetical protein
MRNVSNNDHIRVSNQPTSAPWWWIFVVWSFFWTNWTVNLVESLSWTTKLVSYLQSLRCGWDSVTEFRVYNIFLKTIHREMFKLSIKFHVKILHLWIPPSPPPPVDDFRYYIMRSLFPEKPCFLLSISLIVPLPETSAWVSNRILRLMIPIKAPSSHADGCNVVSDYAL